MLSRKRLSFSIWDAINYRKEKVFYMPYSSIHKFIVEVKYCRKCDKELPVGFRKNDFIVSPCTCSSDRKCHATIEKLTTLFKYEDAVKILKTFNDTKTRKFPNRKKHWINLGYTEEEAREFVREVQTDRSANSPSTQKGTRLYSVRCKEYWLNQGLSSKEAAAKVAKFQTHNGIEWYKARYGHREGTIKYNARMKKWQESYNRALENDPTIIQRKSVRLGKASKKSLQVFLPVYKEYKDKTRIYLGIEESQEYFIREDKTLYFYDFTLPDLKLIVEFNGSKFHPNFKLLEKTELKSWRALFSGYNAETVMALDKAKRSLAEEKGFTVLVIWDTDDVSESIEKIKQIIEDRFREN